MSPRRLYRDFTSVDEIDIEYAIHLTVDDFAGYADSYARRSEQAREALSGKLGVKYGPTKAECFDFFPADVPNAPVVIFLHGGYWYASGRTDWSFLAEGLVKAGVSVVIEEYALCPQVSMSEIVRQHRALLAHIVNHSAELDIDPSRIVVVGHSAGGHGVAMLLSTDWEDYGLRGSPISLVMSISGVLDLRPIPFSFVGPHVQLSADEVDRLSPMLHIPKTNTPIDVVVGAHETSEFIRQSRDYAMACERAGLSVSFIELDRNHYDIVDELWLEGGVLLDRICTHVNTNTFRSHD